MKQSICQICFNFECSWHCDFKPVDGWDAIHTQIPDIGESYLVKKCPLFCARKKNTITPTTLAKLGEICGLCSRQVARKLKTNPTAFKKILFNHGYLLQIEENKQSNRTKFYIMRV